MRLTRRKLLLALFELSFAPFLVAEEFAIKAPKEGGMFSKEGHISSLVYTSEWLVKGSAGLFAIVCFIGAGNYARQGHYGRAAGSLIGGVITSIGSYLVHFSQNG